MAEEKLLSDMGPPRPLYQNKFSVGEVGVEFFFVCRDGGILVASDVCLHGARRMPPTGNWLWGIGLSCAIGLGVELDG